VTRYLLVKQAENPVGEKWLRRIRYELLRFPTLLSSLDGGGRLSQPDELSPARLAIFRREVPWEKATLAQHFAALRGFLRWAKNPLADTPGLWRLPSGQPTHRRWLSREQLLRLAHSATEGPERLLVVLEGFNGLRRVEALRLRGKDVLLPEGCLRVLGKGRDGGKWRTIPMHPAVRSALLASTARRRPEERLLPFGATRADFLLRRAAQRAGLYPTVMVSHHDLRRTFGRLSHEAGLDLVQLQHLYGHQSVDMTAHYIGLDAERMREGLQRYAAFLGDATALGGGRTLKGSRRTARRASSKAGESPDAGARPA